ncbi:MAG TPA: CCA tRNA nucleotidyltransferase [Acidimicrobiia bacterium]|jgi:poly(A) polymerase
MIPARLQWLVEDGRPARELAERFSAAGRSLYLVGGSVRDAFLDRAHEDLDFTTDARPQEIRKIVSGWAEAVYRIGEAFGTIGVHRGEFRAEITTFRREIYRDASRKPQVEYSDQIEEDLSRRDFTVNAVALSLPELTAVDPYGGLVDLAKHVLRTPLTPEISFGDDPLRMLRLFRFQSTIGFAPDAAARLAVADMASRLQIVSAERIRDELSKLLLGDQAADALAGLVESGLASYTIPELTSLAMEQDPVHRHKDVLAHTLAVVHKTEPDLTVRLAALLHDIGKPATRNFEAEGVTFHHHEVVGSRMARERLRALRYPNDVVDDVSRLVFLHLRPHTLEMGWSDSAVRRYVRDAGPLLSRLNQLVRADVTTANRSRAAAIATRLDELDARIEELAAREELEAMRPPIDGHQAMRYLGLEPGPLVGEVMDLLYERRIESGPYPAGEAYALLREWAIEHGRPDPDGPSS